MDKSTRIFRRLTATLVTIIIIVFSGQSTVTFGQSDALANKPPVIVVASPINGEINQAVTINTPISDPDGNITSIIWNQEDEFPPVNMNVSLDKQSMSFIPKQNVTYVFSIEAVDNNGSTTLKSVQVNVGP
jgi:K319L-like, PKD domain